MDSVWSYKAYKVLKLGEFLARNIMSPSGVVGVFDPYSRRSKCVVPASELLSLAVLAISA